MVDIVVEQGTLEVPNLKNVSALHKFLHKHDYLFVKAWTKNSPSAISLPEVLSIKKGDIYEEWNRGADVVVLRILGSSVVHKHHPHLEEYDDMYEALRFVRKVR